MNESMSLSVTERESMRAIEGASESMNLSMNERASLSVGAMNV